MLPQNKPDRIRGGEWSPSGAYVLSADLARVNIGWTMA